MVVDRPHATARGLWVVVSEIVSEIVVAGAIVLNSYRFQSLNSYRFQSLNSYRILKFPIYSRPASMHDCIFELATSSLSDWSSNLLQVQCQSEKLKKIARKNSSNVVEKKGIPPVGMLYHIPATNRTLTVNFFITYISIWNQKNFDAKKKNPKRRDLLRGSLSRAPQLTTWPYSSNQPSEAGLDKRICGHLLGWRMAKRRVSLPRPAHRSLSKSPHLR